MKWFKFYGQDWHTDPKIASMSMEDRLCLLALFTISSTEEKNGFIPYLDEESLIRLAGIPDYPEQDYNPAAVAKGVLKRYETLRIVTLGGNGEVTVRNWGVRQGGNTSNAEKQKRYRERLKIRSNNSSNVTVTEGNAVVTPLPRIDKNRIDKEEGASNEALPLQVVSDTPPKEREGKVNKNSVAFKLREELYDLFEAEYRVRPLPHLGDYKQVVLALKKIPAKEIKDMVESALGSNKPPRTVREALTARAIDIYLQDNA